LDTTHSFYDAIRKKNGWLNGVRRFVQEKEVQSFKDQDVVVKHHDGGW